MLYLVEFADWNSQVKIGYGCGNGYSHVSMGYTDSMKFHTGTTQSSKTTYGFGTQYRHIEGIWDNVYDFCDGIRFDGTSIYCILNPTNFSDSAGGTLIGTRPTSNGYIKAWGDNPNGDFNWALYPSDVSGAQSTYICDSNSYNSTGKVLTVGGDNTKYLNHGMFYMGGTDTAETTYAGIGSRLMVLP